MEMIVIATHMVKPSSPTPNKSKHHKLARLDQLVPSSYIPLIFFYQNDRSHDHVSITRRLKESLSETLTVFYPFAGTIKGNSFVDCDDTGAEFVEARVHGRRLAPFIQNPNIEELEKLVPVDSLSHNDNILLSLKISYFDCGGFSVGACLSHKIGDAASLVIFMNAWAGKTLSSRMIHPNFDLAVRFPPMDEHSFSPFSITREDKVTMRRLVFEGEKIEKLRQEAAALSSVKNPSRVEALSAFIIGNFIEAKKGKSVIKSWTVTHAVNIRSRSDPPLPDHTVGNCIVVAAAVIGSSSIGPIVSKLRAAIRAACDKDYIHLYTSKAQEDVKNVTGDSPKLESAYVFSSWCRFPVYDVDFFGWGKPVWVATAPMAHKNFTYMISTPSGDGMEAWINFDLDEDYHFFQLLQAKLKGL